MTTAPASPAFDPNESWITRPITPDNVFERGDEIRAEVLRRRFLTSQRLELGRVLFPVVSAAMRERANRGRSGPKNGRSTKRYVSSEEVVASATGLAREAVQRHVIRGEPFGGREVPPSPRAVWIPLVARYRPPVTDAGGRPVALPPRPDGPPAPVRMMAEDAHKLLVRLRSARALHGAGAMVAGREGAAFAAALEDLGHEFIRFGEQLSDAVRGDDARHAA